MIMKKRYLLFLLALICTLALHACMPDGYLMPEESQSVDDVELDDFNTYNDSTAGSEGSINGFDAVMVIILSLGFGALIVWFFITMVPIKLWFNAMLSGLKISWLYLIKMRWQNIPQDKIINLMVTAKNANVILDVPLLMKYFLAKVDLEVVVATMIRARAANIKDVNFEDMAQLYLKKVDVGAIVHAFINAQNAQIETSIPELAEFYLAGGNVGDLVKAKNIADNSGHKEELDLPKLKQHYLAGGNLKKTIEAYISARKAGLTDFTFKDICDIDLANLDVTEAIKSAISPIVVETDGVRGIARDGVELTMRVKVTLRAQIKNIIGGVSADTVLARVNEALATQIGLAGSHTDILQNPYLLADKVEGSPTINANSAFEVLSVDVSDIKIGNDVGASIKVARAKAQVEYAKAELILAEEKVQKAMASAFLDGNISVTEYTDIKNKQADTLMRQNLANTDVTGHHLAKNVDTSDTPDNTVDGGTAEEVKE